MKKDFSLIATKTFACGILLFLLGGQSAVWAAASKEAAPAKATEHTPAQAADKTPASLGEDPGPIYTQLVLQWAKTTRFAQNAAQVIVGKFAQEMENDPKMKAVVSKEMLADLEQFFYELFLSPETIKELAILYSQYFTLDDMQDLIKFYQSPVGEKLIKADPELKLKTQIIGQILLKKHEKEYMALIGKYLVKDKATPKAQSGTQ